MLPQLPWSITGPLAELPSDIIYPVASIALVKPLALLFGMLPLNSLQTGAQGFGRKVMAAG